MADVPYSENLIHCTSSQGNNPLKAVDGGGFLDNNITFTADQGYSFTKNGKYVVTYVPENAYGQGPSTKTIVPTDPKKFTITIKTDQFDVDDGYGNHTSYSLTLEATKDAIVPTVNGFTNIYNPTQTDLNALASERYEVPAGGDKFTIYDYGQFITNLISVPFKIPTELIDKVDNIQLGNKKLNATSTKLNNHLLSIDIGSIKVAGKYQNLFDYKNVKCKIYCPYIEPIEIDVVDIMDKTLKINYLLDFYTGQANITITNSDNKIIYTDIKKVSNDLPFIQLSNNVVDKQQNAFFDNGIRKAYVEIIRNIPILNDKGYPTLESGKLKDYTGYIEVDNISLSTNANEQEQQEIKSKLRNGVKIKGLPAYVHNAWSWSADGTDRFTTVYPGENLFTLQTVTDINGLTILGNGITYQNGGWAREFMSNSMLKTILSPDTEYSVQYTFQLLSKESGTVPYQQITHGSILLYSGVTGYPSINLGQVRVGNYADAQTWVAGTTRVRKSTFKTPVNLYDTAANYRIIYYTMRSVNSDGTLNVLEKGKFYDVKFEKGDTPTIYTPAPSDDYANAYPTYTGTLTDFNPAASQNYKDYTWARVQGNEF